MTPLLDVIFLLLTFFIFALVVTVQAQVLPIRLPELTTGETARDAKIAGVTVDGSGNLFLNREPVTRQQLRERLKELAALPQPPAFYLAIDAGEGEVDRGPILIEAIEMFRSLGIKNLNIVGQPRARAEERP